MTVGWKKIVRVTNEFRVEDLFNTRNIPPGKMFRVRFPSGSIMTLPAIIQHETLLISEVPFFQIAKRVFFSVQYEGLPSIWVRGIDVEVQEFFDASKHKKKK